MNLKQTYQSSKPKTFNIKGFELITPRFHIELPQKHNPADKWQHPLNPKPKKTAVLENDLTTTKSLLPTPETQPEDLNEL